VQKHAHAFEQAQHTQQRETLFALERLKVEQNAVQRTLQTLEQEKKSCTTENKTVIQLIDAAHKQKETHALSQETYQRFVARGNMLQAELRAITQKMHLSQDKDDPSCPLCSQNLSATRRRFLQVKLTKDAHHVHHRLERLKRVIPRLKETLVTQHKIISAYQKSLEEHAAAQATLEAQTQKQHELSEKIKRLEIQCTEKNRAVTDIQKQIEAHQKTLVSSADDQQLQKLKADRTAAQTKLENLVKQSPKIEYDSAAHQKTHDEMKLLEQQLQSQEHIRHQQTLQDERKKKIAEMCVQLKKQKQQQAYLTEQLKAYVDLVKQKAVLTQKECDIKKQLDIYRQEKEALLQKKGNLESEQKKLAAMASEHASQKKKIAHLNESMRDYHAIAQAASKDGIQALLIEDALPEIEQEANGILAKLTDNQAYLIIESLRDLKKGGTKETLDIKISDAAGIRPYELFSGGEAFRIDFALRIAISKLLARRAGTALQTLIIDEGFGSQDEDGLAHIMDAIYAIQGDFAKVIIVSHLSSMKDQFPVHFVVEKGASGSVVRVVEQG